MFLTLFLASVAIGAIALCAFVVFASDNFAHVQVGDEPLHVAQAMVAALLAQMAGIAAVAIVVLRFFGYIR